MGQDLMENHQQQMTELLDRFKILDDKNVGKLIGRVDGNWFAEVGYGGHFIAPEEGDFFLAPNEEVWARDDNHPKDSPNGDNQGITVKVSQSM